jgi:hypothetical protein
MERMVANTWFPIYISKVEYVDWIRHDGDTENLIGMYVRKADGYMHESEVRLIVGDTVPEPFRVSSEEAPRAAPIDLRTGCAGGSDGAGRILSLM